MAEPQWLTADQLAAWRCLMQLTQELPAALDFQLQRDAQLSMNEYHVMAFLADQPERRMRMSDLADEANLELSRLSHMVSRLGKRGLLCREPDPCDGRYTHVILTDAGRAYQAAAAPAHVERARELVIDVLDDEELQTLHRLAEKVTSRIRSLPDVPKTPAGPCRASQPGCGAEAEAAEAAESAEPVL